MAVTMNENANSSEHTLAGGPPPHVAGLAVRSLDQLTDPVVDPRVRLETRPDAEELDEGLVTQLSDVLHHKGHHYKSHESSQLEKGSVEGEKQEIFYVSTLQHAFPSVYSYRPPLSNFCGSIVRFGGFLRGSVVQLSHPRIILGRV